MPIYSLDGEAPVVPKEGHYWVAPDANVIGKVTLGEDATVWFGSTLRGDTERITVGPRSNMQEHGGLHTDPGKPLTIGEDCTIGHRVTLHGCTIGDNTLIGMGAVILNGARIGKYCLVGANALITEGKEFPDYSLIVGSPAVVTRTRDETFVKQQLRSATHYAANGKRFARGLAKIR